jgi:hypothetical protein
LLLVSVIYHIPLPLHNYHNYHKIPLQFPVLTTITTHPSTTMARTKYVPPAGTSKHLHPPRGTIHQQSLRVLWNDTDIMSYPLRAREALINEVLPGWNSTWHRDRALKGLRPRLDSDFALKPGFEGVKKQEIMAVRDAARARKVRKLMGAMGSQRVGEGMASELVSADKNRVLVGGDGDRKWVLGDGARRALGLGIGDRAAGHGVFVGGKQGRDKRAATQLRKETEFWGGYRDVKSGLMVC